MAFKTPPIHVLVHRWTVRLCCSEPTDIMDMAVAHVSLISTHTEHPRPSLFVVQSDGSCGKGPPRTGTGSRVTSTAVPSATPNAPEVHAAPCKKVSTARIGAGCAEAGARRDTGSTQRVLWRWRSGRGKSQGGGCDNAMPARTEQQNVPGTPAPRGGPFRRGHRWQYNGCARRCESSYSYNLDGEPKLGDIVILKKNNKLQPQVCHHFGVMTAQASLMHFYRSPHPMIRLTARPRKWILRCCMRVRGTGVAK